MDGFNVKMSSAISIASKTLSFLCAKNYSFGRGANLTMCQTLFETSDTCDSGVKKPSDGACKKICNRNSPI